MKLVVAEKGKLARDIARAMCGKPGVNDKTPLPISGNGYTVCAASGHLLELVEPEEYDARLAQSGGDWGIEDLPIFFPDWKKEVKRATDESGRKTRHADSFAQGRVDAIGGLLEGADEVINAGDPDDEGQCLVDELIDHFGYDGPVRRVYVNDSIEKNIVKAFACMKPNDDCRPDGEAAYARSMADLVFGLNESRLISRRLHAGNLSVGRVQTPTLGLVVNRDLAIENHVRQDYFEIGATFTCDGAAEPLHGRFAPSAAFVESHSTDGKHVCDRAAMQAEADAAREQGSNLSLHVVNRKEREAAPLPYNITSLEADMNTRFGFKAADTLAITQALRDRYSAITYNRTSSSYLKEEHWQDAMNVLPVACRNIGLDVPLDFSLKSKAFDDAKVTAHHGLIPQEIEVDVGRMTESEGKVYRAIVERYAAQFLPLRVSDVCEGQAPVADGTLKYKVKRVVDEGWARWFKRQGKEGEDDAGREGAFLPDGDHRASIVSTELAPRQTHPPKPYTEATLLKDMSSIAKYVGDPDLKAALKKKDEDDPDENGGIGTSATRPSIIEALKRRGFIEEKDGKVRSTQKGRDVYSIIPDDVKTADVTARWWLAQEDIRHGKAGRNSLPAKVAEQFRSHRDTAYVGIEIPPSLASSGARKSVGKCPICGSDVLETKKTYSCASNRYAQTADGSWRQTAGDGFKMWKSVARKPLTKKQVAELLAGKTVHAKGLKSKAGKTFDAYLRLKPGCKGDVEMVFGGKGK